MWLRLQNLLLLMTGKRRERAAQFYSYLFINQIVPEDPAALEEELNECVKVLVPVCR